MSQAGVTAPHKFEPIPPFPAVPAASGAMDGVRVPASQVEAIKMLAMAQWNKYSYVTKSVRSWKEFVIVSKPASATADLLMKKVMTNVTYFQYNYLLLISVFMLFSLLTSPTCIFLFAGLGAGWVAFMRKNEDPSWNPVVAGIPLAKAQRSVGMSILSGFAVLIFAGSLILSVLGMSALVVVVHAVLNNSSAPNQLESAPEEDDPINQI